MAESEDHRLEAPAHLGRSRFEERPTLSERSVGSVGLLAVLALVAVVGGFIGRQWAFAWLALGLFLVACPGFVLLVRRLMREQEATERRRRPRVLR
jgi:hypothetical protein